MFSRTDRTGERQPSLTHVGPATYVIYSPRDLREEAVPFRFKIGHRFLTGSNDSPSPCSYTVEQPRRIKGAAWSKQTQVRNCMVPPTIEEASRNVDLESSSDKIFDFSGAKILSHSATLRHVVRPLLAKPVRRSPDLSKKSVVLKKRKSSSFDSSRRPCNQCNTYKGSHWSKYKEKRFNDRGFSSNDNPGPGAYYLCDLEPTPQERWFEFRRFVKRATTRIPRFTNSVESGSRENLPGPGDTVFTDYIWRKQSHNKKGTFSKAPRISSLQGRDTPSPADYNVGFKSAPSTTQFAPFLSRSQNKDSAVNTPGPADYNPPQGTVAFNACQKLPTMFASYVAPFGISSARMTESDVDCLPGPASYDLTPQEPVPLFGVKKSAPRGREKLLKDRVRAIFKDFSSFRTKLFYTMKSFS